MTHDKSLIDKKELLEFVASLIEDGAAKRRSLQIRIFIKIALIFSFAAAYVILLGSFI